MSAYPFRKMIAGKAKPGMASGSGIGSDDGGTKIAVFPLVHGKHPAMAIGLVIHSEHHIAFMRSIPDIIIISAAGVQWSNAACWMYEDNMHTMSTKDTSSYLGYMEVSDAQVRQATWASWEPFESHLRLHHFEAFGNLWRELQNRSERRFRKIPVPRSSTVKQASLDQGRSNNSYEDAIRSLAK